MKICLSKRMNPDTVIGLNNENQVCNAETNKTLYRFQEQEQAFNRAVNPQKRQKI